MRGKILSIGQSRIKRHLKEFYNFRLSGAVLTTEISKNGKKKSRADDPLCFAFVLWQRSADCCDRLREARHLAGRSVLVQNALGSRHGERALCLAEALLCRSLIACCDCSVDLLDSGLNSGLNSLVSLSSLCGRQNSLLRGFDVCQFLFLPFTDTMIVSQSSRQPSGTGSRANVLLSVGVRIEVWTRTVQCKHTLKL